MGRIDKIKLSLLLVLRILLIIACGVAVAKSDWKDVVLSLFALFLTFLPDIIEKKMRIEYPSEFEILILIFIFASIYLGEVQYFYERFWWWDVFLHSLSGIIIGGIGFLLVYILNREKSVAFKLSPGFVAVFSFCFAASIGVIWEIIEFAIDIVFKWNMQKSGLVDTMWDLIIDLLAALGVSFLGYMHLKGDINIFRSIEKKFFTENPSLLKDE